MGGTTGDNNTGGGECFGPGYDELLHHVADYLDGVSGRLLGHAIGLARASVWRRDYPAPHVGRDTSDLLSMLERCGDSRTEALARLAREIGEVRMELPRTSG